jgi:hypothetical protein
VPRVTLAILALAVQASGQWLNFPTPGIPRTKDGKPNLTAPAPRTAAGKPDLSGLWEKTNDKFYNNVAAELKPGDVLPEADKLYQQRRMEFGKDSMETRCVPMGIAYTSTPYRYSRIVQTPSIVVILNSDLTYRQIFMDGRKLETDPNPTWMGYSVGHWDGDTLVIESKGFNDKTWLDYDGHPHSEDLFVTERFKRRDSGHIDVAVTFNDPKNFAKPFTVPIVMDLMPDTEMIESVCENEKDRLHMPSGKVGETQVPPAVLAKYAGLYELEQEKKSGKIDVAEISILDGALLLEVNRGGKQKLIAVSQTDFSLSGTVIKFVPEPDGSVNRLLIHEVERETKATRKK